MLNVSETRDHLRGVAEGVNKLTDIFREMLVLAEVAEDDYLISRMNNCSVTINAISAGIGAAYKSTLAPGIPTCLTMGDVDAVAFSIWASERQGVSEHDLFNNWQRMTTDVNTGEVYLGCYRDKALCAISTFVNVVQHA